MVVCKFFQQGHCRYGQNCRFEHIYGSKYSYHATQQPTPPPAATITDEMLVNQVQADVQAVLGGKQWILSCYSPYKEKPCFPGICDLSTEEARLIFYEGQITNNLDKAVVFFNNMIQDARYKYEQLLQPNATIINVLRSLYNGEVLASPFTNNMSQNTTFGGNATSVFRTAMQNTSVFNQPTNNTSIFGQPQNSNVQTSDAAKSIFSQASQNIFATNATPSMFVNEQSASSTNPKSIFSQASQSIFGQANPAPVAAQANPSNIFANATQNIFRQQEQTPFTSTTAQNVFQKPVTQNGLGSNVFQKQVVDDAGIYSKMEDLTEEDMEAYQSEEFRIGCVPEIAPPYSLCF